MGNGQGYVYDPNGNLLANLASTAVNPLPGGAHTYLTLDPAGYLYTMDASTGIHVFDTNAPEPSTFLLTGAALLLLAGKGRQAWPHRLRRLFWAHKA